MRYLTISAAVAACAFAATPALANEARVEARGGIAWVSGTSTESIGLAVGYDADLDDSFFAGIEAVADTDFDFSDPVLGVNARLGANVGEGGKAFVTAGYAYDTWSEFDDAVIGAGYQHNIGTNALLSIQYQRYVDLDINRATVGLGFRF
ncbi:MAG: hypothetical protein V4647_11600 [Pseudomonadota bacterium]